MAIQLVTFGGLHAVEDTGELQRLLGQHSRAALFVYLATERRVSRESLTTVFWPESDAENARHALRQSLYHLRKAVGVDWIDSRAHELVVRDDVRTDAHAFTEALERGDTESAVRLYQGPFLDGVHLLDLKPWESWVDTRRAQFARAFRKACRDVLEAKRAAGDLAGAVEAAERWTAPNPADDEAQHRLIETLAAAGERTEAIRQYETYARMLEADGLRPLDETEALAKRLRSDSIPLPALRTAPPPVEQPSFAESADAREPERAKTRRRPHRFVVAAVVATLFVAGVWTARSRTVAPPRGPSTTIAVLPFTVRGGESFRYLGDGIVNLLATALDGAGSLRPVDTRATFAAVAEAGGTVSDAQHADPIAARLGAGKFVLGDVVEAGGMLHIEAAVYDGGAACVRPLGCPAPQVAAKAVVSGVADSVFELVDRLAAQLLGGLGDPSADRLLRTAALTTTSLPAFKAYLEGEGLMRAGQFERAADSYLAAIALDSTFAVADYRLALAREWAPLPGEEDAANAAVRHEARLSSRDRALLEAFREWRAGDATEADRGYREILARYPDDVDAWFQLGEIQFHHGPLVGHPVEESEDAWRKVLAYEPKNLFALTHVARIVAMPGAGRASALDSLLAQFTPEELRTDRRLEEILILRAVARGDTAAARARAQDVRRGEGLSTWRVAAWLTAFSPDPAIMHAVIQELSKDYQNPRLGADLLWFASVLDLAGGRVDAARIARAQATGAERAVPAKQRRWAFDAVTEWYAATLPLPYADSTLMRVRRQAMSFDPHASPAESGPAFENEMGMGTPIQVEPVRQYTLGVLSLRLKDTAAAAAAAAKLADLAASGHATALVRDLDRGLRARLAWHNGHPNEALHLLESLESRDSQGDIAVIPFVTRANERFLRGELLASLGRDAESLRWFTSLGNASATEIPLRALSDFRQAEIHERLGNREQAAKHYTEFVAMWRNADAEFQPLVDSARRRLASVAKLK